MRRLSEYLAGIDGLPQDIAWVMVDRLYQDIAALITGAMVGVMFGVAGYLVTGSPWYLASTAYSALVLLWRLGQSAAYRHADRAASPEPWALRSLYSGSAAAVGWGAMTLVIPFEPMPMITACMVGLHAGLVTGGAVRNATVGPIVVSQSVLASGPLFLSCALSGQTMLQAYSGMVLLHFVVALKIGGTLRGQTLELLLREREKSDIADRLAIANQELAATNRHLEMMAGTDALTELANRRAFDLNLAREWRRAQREGGPISLLLLDIDHFKAFNDFYGHQAGDTCLHEVAATIAAAVTRPGDIVARYGGEEFAVVLSATSLDGAAHVAESILGALADRGLQHDASAFGVVTLSIGVACTCPGPDDTPDLLIARTDAALYAAKRSGRNRMHLAEPVSAAPADGMEMASPPRAQA